MFGHIIRFVSTIPFLAMLTSCTWMAAHPEEVKQIEEDVVDAGEVLFKIETKGLKDVPLSPRPKSVE